MLCNLKFNEYEAIKFDVSIDDILILDYIFKNQDKFICKTFNNEKYYWVDYEEMLSKLPILNIKKDTLYRKLKKLCKNGVLKHKLFKHPVTYSLYGFTDVFYKILDKSEPDDFQNTTIKNPNTSEELHNQNGLLTIIDEIKSTVNGFSKDMNGNNSLSKSIYNILNNILMLFNNIKSINRFYIYNNQKNNNKIYNNYTNTNTTYSSTSNINYNLSKDLNPNNQEVYSYYTEKGFGSLTSHVVLTLNKLVNNHDLFTVLTAMDEAINKGNIRLCYVEGILNNWKNNKINNMQNQYKYQSSNKGTFNGFHQRQYNFDELEKELVANKFW
ncbi:MAG: DnaD domain protein [Clostridium sp.]